MVKNLPAMQETWVRSLGQEDPLEKGMATHYSIPAWRIPWTEEPGGLQSTGLQRVGETERLTHSPYVLIFCVQRETKLCTSPPDFTLRTFPSRQWGRTPQLESHRDSHTSDTEARGYKAPTSSLEYEPLLLENLQLNKNLLPLTRENYWESIANNFFIFGIFIKPSGPRPKFTTWHHPSTVTISSSLSDWE